MRSPGRVTVLAAALILAVAAGSLRADDASSGLDRAVVVVGEDRVVLQAPEPAGWAAVELPDLDLVLPAGGPDSPFVPPIPPWTAPAPVQVIAMMEATDA
ncbi:MAG: hypothetical protein NTU62_15050 [Spirochaetes bacterium]|jgi:hypothetical protein|nr:hypothetical protein [Spirochaetota bacterium]